MSSDESEPHHNDTTLHHDDTVPKFGGLQDLPTTHLKSSHPSTEEEEEEDRTSNEENSNPVTSTPLVEPAAQVSRTGVLLHLTKW